MQDIQDVARLTHGIARCRGRSRFLRGLRLAVKGRDDDVIARIGLRRRRPGVGGGQLLVPAPGLETRRAQQERDSDAKEGGGG